MLVTSTLFVRIPPPMLRLRMKNHCSTVIEFVTRDDEQVKKLLLNKEDQYHDYSLDNFEAELGGRFEIVERQRLGSGNRYLYYCTH